MWYSRKWISWKGYTWVCQWKLPNVKTNQTVKRTQTLHNKNTSSDKALVYPKQRSQLAHCTIPVHFHYVKTCQRQIQVLNKVPLVTHHLRKQVFRLLLQKQTSDSRRWWNRAAPKLFWRSSEPAKPAAAWSMPLTLPLSEREKESKAQERARETREKSGEKDGMVII